MARIKKDQGTPDGRDIGGRIAMAMHDVYARRAAAAEPCSDDDWRRDHLGCSIAGHECDRYVWLSFRWAMDPKHDGRLLRLFGRGKVEEDRVIEDLIAAGYAVNVLICGLPEEAEFRFADGPLGGTIDGRVRGGELGDQWHVLEVKTHNAKSFARVAEKGVKSAKEQHWIQMQLYMHLSGGRYRSALYVAVNKDDESIYCEVVDYDEKAAKRAHIRALDIASRFTAPERQLDKDQPPCVYTRSDGTRFECQFYALCHGKRLPDRSCRTCIECMPSETDRGFDCTDAGSKLKGPLSPLSQREGCMRWVPEPSMVNASVVAVDDVNRRIDFQFPDGEVRRWQGGKES